MGDRNERVRRQLVYIESEFDCGVHRVNRTFTVTYTPITSTPQAEEDARYGIFKTNNFR
jgi:hypothetical protein